MRSDLRALRERIRQVEAGGRRDTPLRRAYNRKLRAHKGLKGGGGDNGLLQSAEEIPDYSFDVKLRNGPTINHHDYHILKGKTKSSYSSPRFYKLHRTLSILRGDLVDSSGRRK